ncbi:uncharacterized protein PAN0_011c4326 [Moesziomyces antarcticus]|uniref:Uncharacterized protein n=2 Tax=Pseudozyma antarctica TaxID=84753 RepID=A0A5C3FRE7_PSEA2|nr:uncharacterized protein PAN0_011c4326 [Moesziomyces antarcticus]GAK66104.1 hypothetical protein PAN0_011c4326 [Moesziomyces antarcticus]SPO46882.1 uncharacterized protein PSANT_04568 [Moesziomyces antarcticus]
MHDPTSVFSGRLLPQPAPKLRRQVLQLQRRDGVAGADTAGSHLLQLPERAPEAVLLTGHRLQARPITATGNQCHTGRSVWALWGGSRFRLGVKQHHDQLMLAGIIETATPLSGIASGHCVQTAVRGACCLHARLRDDVGRAGSAHRVVASELASAIRLRATLQHHPRPHTVWRPHRPPTC